MENNRGLFGFCLGCGVGALAAVLLAPKSGRETIAYLGRKASEGTDYVKRQVDDASKAAKDTLAQGTKAVESQVENLRSAVDAGQET